MYTRVNCVEETAGALVKIFVFYTSIHKKNTITINVRLHWEQLWRE